MKPSYKTLENTADELVIKKSKFLSFIYNIRDEGEAQSILRTMREKYSDATHICYAYVLGLDANVERFSDDGEPSGTAGLPILEMLKNSNNSEVLGVVVRYFGGIKLGAGGLIRAYSEAIKNCIAKALEVEFVLSGIYQIDLDFSAAKKINQLLANITCKTLEISYNDRGAVFTVAVPSEVPLQKLVTDFLSGKQAAKQISSDYINYKQK